MDWFFNLNPIVMAFFATTFTWFINMCGASLVFFVKSSNRVIMDVLLSVASGVMIAASFFSLLLPSLEMADNLNMTSWIVVSFGFLLGGLLLFFGDKLFNRINTKSTNKTGLKRVLMMVTSITLHNIPEGLAIGVAFGSIIYGIEGATVSSALLLALGIGIQNFPEGSSVSLPLLREGYSAKKAFFIGQISGIVEPIAGVLGALLVLKVRLLLPFLLAFAAGAMIYVVCQELIPECQKSKKKDLMALFTLIGFTIMMILDVSLS